MRLLFASDSFKGSLTSRRAAQLLARAAEAVFDAPRTRSVLVADGGEGTVDAVLTAVDGERVRLEVHDPLMRPVQAEYGLWAGDRAVIEMAAASGLPLVEEGLRDPSATTSFGTGEMIRHALSRGARDLFIGIGGSATNDGGMGCMQALGARFLDAEGRPLPGVGESLARVCRVDVSGLDPRLGEASVTVLCDVRNPLCGPEGATLTFGPQKGGTPETLARLEEGMRHYAQVLSRFFGTDCATLAGGGAAGGLGAALSLFCRGKRKSGIDTVLDLIGFDELLEDTDLVVTGEGRTDAQSCLGKVMQGVGLRARRKGVPAVGLSGALGEGAMGVTDCGILSLMAGVCAPMSLEEALARAEENYLSAAIRMFRFVRLGMDLGGGALRP